MELEKRSRSPNYPAISLPEAIEKLSVLSGAIHNHAAPREVIARGMGYAGLSGASATAISALQKYGLLDRNGEELRISERGKAILHPHSPAEKAKAIMDAAAEPKLFAELREKFPGKIVNEDLLRNFLVRNGFAPAALSSAVLAFRQTEQFVENFAGDCDSHQSPVPMEQPKMLTSPVARAPATSPPSIAPSLSGGEPYSLSLSPGRLRGAFNLTNTDDADELIAAINAWKSLARPTRTTRQESNSPIGSPEDDHDPS
jgi:hypothetical protein